MPSLENLVNIILLAIFDGILIHLLFDIESKTNISWQNVKRLMYNLFNIKWNASAPKI